MRHCGQSGTAGTERLVDASASASSTTAESRRPRHPPPTAPVKPGNRRILILLSEWGYWGEELVGPLDEFDRVGYEVDFCTPTGRRPNAIPVSMDPDFFDPPLQRSVTSPRNGRARPRDRRSVDPAGQAPATIRSTSPAWFPERPYFASSQFVRLLEDYNWDLRRGGARHRRSMTRC